MRFRLWFQSQLQAPGPRTVDFAPTPPAARMPTLSSWRQPRGSWRTPLPFVPRSLRPVASYHQLPAPSIWHSTPGVQPPAFGPQPPS